VKMFRELRDGSLVTKRSAPGFDGDEAREKPNDRKPLADLIRKGHF
jgi:hypothetical protein